MTEKNTPAPAAGQAGAVPDSLRALSEAATQGDWYTESEKCDGSYGSGEDCGEGYLAYNILTDAERPHGTPGVIAETSNSTLGVIHEESDEDGHTAWDETARANTAFIVAAVNFVRTRIATHPAGQSAGSGADALDAARFRALMRCGRIKMQGSAGVDADTGVLKYPDQPGSVHFGAEFWPQSEGEADRHTIWGRHCLRALADDILALEGPAPDSTRTGDEGTERLREAVSKALHDNQFLDGWPEMVDPVVNAVLAARPAAPEAQGAWLPIETAPKDGTHVIAHDEHYGVCEAVWHRAFDDLAEETFEGLWDLNHSALNEATGWQPMPAPPASSGQGGR